MHVRLGLLGDNSFGQAAAIVFNEAVLPFEKIGDGLRFNADLDAAEAGEEKIHLPHQAGLAALALAAGFDGDTNIAALTFKQSPLGRKLVDDDQALRDEIKALAAHGKLGIFAEGLVAVGEEVSAGDFAFDHHGAAGALPADDVGCLAAGAGLLGEDDAATISGAKPLLGKTDERGVGHEFKLAQNCIEEK